MERISFPRICYLPTLELQDFLHYLKLILTNFQIFIAIRYPSFENTIGENFKSSDSVTYCGGNLTVTILTAQSSESYVAITKSKTIGTW